MTDRVAGRRGADDHRHIWRVVSVYSDGRRHVEGRWLTKGAAELLVEDIQIYREENPLLGGGEEPRLVVERVGTDSQ